MWLRTLALCSGVRDDSRTAAKQCQDWWVAWCLTAWPPGLEISNIRQVRLCHCICHKVLLTTDLRLIIEEQELTFSPKKYALTHPLESPSLINVKLSFCNRVFHRTLVPNNTNGGPWKNTQDIIYWSVIQKGWETLGETKVNTFLFRGTSQSLYYSDMYC